MIEKMIFRKQSEEIIKLYKDKNVIKILSGIRRSGKSFMLREVWLLTAPLESAD